MHLLFLSPSLQVHTAWSACTNALHTNRGAFPTRKIRASLQGKRGRSYLLREKGSREHTHASAGIGSRGVLFERVPAQAYNLRLRTSSEKHMQKCFSEPECTMKAPHKGITVAFLQMPRARHSLRGFGAKLSHW